MDHARPSMTALLGLLAVAGFQNKDRIAEMLGGGRTDPGGPAEGGLGDLLRTIGGALGGAGAGTVVSGGLGELVDRFRRNGHGAVTDSWVGQGPNRDIAPHHLEQAIGPDMLETLSRQTGLSRDDLLSRLSRMLPSAVDRYTPDGRLPAP
ncbi:hypothetical protein OPKNFCMD_1377 [Methylobacterium crusticola]|uniref:DUF937 domain-containing protein n=1 Tax=Methylobacterium crusticola TaxID=1697972 RepID=A0ABQ4QUN6_9HYPH|nr:YidB family protein [Methylobacterium crusticola]GJD48654.1 hypothetical protein OPKNFCMD_1377 [Methylobacterium crusticola]